MEIILIDAPRAVQRSWIAFGLYVVLVVPVEALVITGESLLGKPPENLPFFSIYTFCDLVGRLIIVLVTAAAQALAFSRMAKEIDKPLWRCKTDGEALQRYFPLWTGINLAVYGLFVLAGQAMSGSEGSAQILFLLAFLFAALSTPLGAVIMFHGKPASESGMDSLSIFSRQIPRMLVIFLASFWIIFLCYYMAGLNAEQRLIQPVITIIGVYFDCLFFAATFQVCRIDRETPEDSSFDF